MARVEEKNAPCGGNWFTIIKKFQNSKKVTKFDELCKRRLQETQDIVSEQFEKQHILIEG